MTITRQQTLEVPWDGEDTAHVVLMRPRGHQCPTSEMTPPDFSQHPCQTFHPLDAAPPSAVSTPVAA